MNIKEENTTENPLPVRRPIPMKTLIIAALALLGVGYYTYSHIRNAHIEATTVVATVNGETIYEAQVNRGLSGDMFDSTSDDLKQNKVARMIAQVAIRQFLAKHNVKVNEKLVDKQIENLEKNPPSMGCPCCTYQSLDDYLSSIGYTRDDLRLEIRNNIGLSDYAETSWKRSHPTNEDVLKEIGNQNELIRQRCVNGWQIFFNTFQQPGFRDDPAQVRKAAERQANKAWDMLQKGKSFAEVAKAVSEDMTSKRKGGKLGIIDRSSYGRQFDAMISTLKPGQYSKPFESPWGYHIIMWKPLTDSDIVDYCKSYFVGKERDRIYSQIMKSAKIERPESQDSGG